MFSWRDKKSINTFWLKKGALYSYACGAVGDGCPEIKASPAENIVDSSLDLRNKSVAEFTCT